MSEKLRHGEALMIMALFPQVYDIIRQALIEKFEFDSIYAPQLFERETIYVLLSLIHFGCIDFDDAFFLENSEDLRTFVKEFVVLNTKPRGFVPLHKLSAYVLFQVPLP